MLQMGSTTPPLPYFQFWDQIPLNCPHWAWIHSVAQAYLLLVVWLTWHSKQLDHGTVAVHPTTCFFIFPMYHFFWDQSLHIFALVFLQSNYFEHWGKLLRCNLPYSFKIKALFLYISSWQFVSFLKLVHLCNHCFHAEEMSV